MAVVVTRTIASVAPISGIGRSRSSILQGSTAPRLSWFAAASHRRAQCIVTRWDASRESA
jgi:hypothetical protein